MKITRIFLAAMGSTALFAQNPPVLGEDTVKISASGTHKYEAEEHNLPLVR